MKFTLFIFIAFSALLVNSTPFVTVPELNLGQYLGEWYEVASSPTVRALMEKGGSCQKAVYTERLDEKFDILNLQIKAEKVDTIAGSGELPDATAPGKLVIDLNLGFKADYWVLALGPVVNGKYEWSVVSEPRGFFMWVLARDPQVYLDTYEATVKPLVTETFGFNKLYNKYLDRPHKGCAPYDQY